MTEDVGEFNDHHIQSGGQPTCVLIVEDEPVTREFFSHLLERQYNVVAVADAETALNRLSQQHFDLILLDIVLPGISGFELLEYLRQRPDTAQVPVIIVTARDDMRDVSYGLRLGANDYITKPAESALILSRIRAQIAAYRLECERRQHIQERESADLIRSRLFRIATHDLKNPLNNLRMAEYLLRSEHNDPKTERILDNIALTVDSMQSVINDFMEMVRLESDEITMAIGPVALGDVVNHVILQQEIAAQHKNITLKAQIDKGVVYGDEGRVIQSLNNLVSNAIKYSPPGTTVLVQTQHVGGAWRIAVVDQGPGVKPEERDLLFKAFSRTSNRPTGQEGSTGLGLWIVRTMMERQGGTVGVEFPERGGSVFWIQLPVAQQMNTA